MRVFNLTLLIVVLLAVTAGAQDSKLPKVVILATGGTIAGVAETGSVVSVHTDGQLHMRYPERSRSFVWRDDP